MREERGKCYNNATREGRDALVSPDSGREVRQHLEVCSHAVAVAKKSCVAAGIVVVIVQRCIARRAEWSRVELLQTDVVTQTKG